MKNASLHIASSAHMRESDSFRAAERLLATLISDAVTTRFLAETPLPQIDAAWVAARTVPAEEASTGDKAILGLSDRLIDELQAADTLVISLPIYNFGLPAALKAWIDLIARPRVTFRYTPEGPIGLLSGKRAHVVVSSGGTRIGSPADFATPHLRHVLGFIGIDDVTVHDAKLLNAAAAA